MKISQGVFGMENFRGVGRHRDINGEVKKKEKDYPKKGRQNNAINGAKNRLKGQNSSARIDLSNRSGNESKFVPLYSIFSINSAIWYDSLAK